MTFLGRVLVYFLWYSLNISLWLTVCLQLLVGHCDKTCTQKEYSIVLVTHSVVSTCDYNMPEALSSISHIRYIYQSGFKIYEKLAFLEHFFTQAGREDRGGREQDQLCRPGGCARGSLWDWRIGLGKRDERTRKKHCSRDREKGIRRLHAWHRRFIQGLSGLTSKGRADPAGLRRINLI